MHTIEWVFLPAPDRVAEAVEMYGPNGEWVKLFERADGYLGTKLVPASGKLGWFRTIDRWKSGKAYKAFRKEFSAKYQALDAACEMLTVDEKPVRNVKATKPATTRRKR